MIILRIVEYSIFDEKFELEELNSLKNSILEFFGSVCSINSNFVLRLRIGQTESIFQRVFHCRPRVMFIGYSLIMMDVKTITVSAFHYTVESL